MCAAGCTKPFSRHVNVMLLCRCPDVVRVKPFLFSHGDEAWSESSWTLSCHVPSFQQFETSGLPGAILLFNLAFVDIVSRHQRQTLKVVTDFG